MSSNTPNYNFILPAVNSAVDQDLWGSELNSNWSAIDTDLKTVSDAADSAKLPIGSIYMNAAVATNPATLLGYGTWTAFAAGRIPIGVGTGTDTNGTMQSFANAATGGEYTHTLVTSETPAHKHFTHAVANPGTSPGSTPSLLNTQQVAEVNVSGSQSSNYNLQPTATAATVGLTSATGSDGAHNNVQPYIAVYMWVRSA